MSEPTPSALPVGNTVPAIPGFYSDPTWCRGRDAYYLANSSFEYFPGAPIFRSEDLVTWSQIGNIIDRPEQTPLLGVGASEGIFGSTLRFHDDRYWFVTTNIGTVEAGQQIFTADDPAGPWSDAVVVAGSAGIDPDLFWDADGTCYLSWTRPPGGIQQARVDPVAGTLLSDPVLLWNGTGMKAPEGPHVYRIGDWYYLLIAEGGTEKGHCVSVARGHSPYGPFTGHPDNPILTHRSSSHPVQSVGHADLLEGPDGTWWLTYHGTRPQGHTPEFHLIGRETMVSPVEWVDGWPVVREDLAQRAPATTSYDDDFRGPLHPRWVSPGGDLSGVATGSGLRLAAGAGPARPVVARVQDLSWRATATIDASAGRSPAARLPRRQALVRPRRDRHRRDRRRADRAAAPGARHGLGRRSHLRRGLPRCGAARGRAVPGRPRARPRPAEGRATRCSPPSTAATCPPRWRPGSRGGPSACRPCVAR